MFREVEMLEGIRHMNGRPKIKKEPPSEDELVLRFFTDQLYYGYKDGWLYYKCRDLGLLKQYDHYASRGVFELLKEKGQQEPKNPKLTIELVPRTCWFSNVRSNVSRAEWDTIRKKTALEAGYKCETCGDKGKKWPVECHEIWAYDDNTLIQKLVGLISLCPPCHSVKHMGFTQLRDKELEATCHLAIVNKWTYRAAKSYIEAQFEVWKQRSEYQWLLDIDWLSCHDISVRNPNSITEQFKNHPDETKKFFINNRKKAFDCHNEGLAHEKKSAYDKAADYYAQASKMGCLDATFNLAVLHLKRKCSTANFYIGITHLIEARKMGDIQARDLLELEPEELLKLCSNDKKEPEEASRTIKDETTNNINKPKPFNTANKTKPKKNIFIDVFLSTKAYFRRGRIATFIRFIFQFLISFIILFLIVNVFF